MEEIWKKYYESYKGVLKVNSGQAIDMFRGSWRSFSTLLKAIKEVRMPPFIKKISPPAYLKDRDLGKRVERIVIRNDRRRLEPVNAGEGYPALRDFGLRIRYAGKMK